MKFQVETTEQKVKKEFFGNVLNFFMKTHLKIEEC